MSNHEGVSPRAHEHCNLDPTKMPKKMHTTHQHFETDIAKSSLMPHTFKVKMKVPWRNIRFGRQKVNRNVFWH